MLNIIKYPIRKDWPSLLQRPVKDAKDLSAAVLPILEKVKAQGDSALFEFTERFDGVRPEAFIVSEKEVQTAAEVLSPELKEAIRQAYSNILAFHSAQVQEELVVETMPGIVCKRRSVAIEKVGIYIPGGTAPLFSTVLMLGIPAKIAGCKEVVLCTPPDKEGVINPAILYSAQLTGVTKIIKCGGAQAIAALAYGTESVPAVYKIFGPGNQYVTLAKQLVAGEGVAIDMPAGPSEVAVLADAKANPAFVAADLLAQAEHGADSQVLVVSDSENLIQAVNEELELQLKLLPRNEFAAKALKNSNAILVKELREGMELLNEYAPEHLIIQCEEDEALSDLVVNAGSVFVGALSPESVGDYASGTNHTLPTYGYAKAYSGVSLDSFVKKITYQRLSKKGLEAIANTVIKMAEAEGLQAHANAVKIRMKKL